MAELYLTPDADTLTGDDVFLQITIPRSLMPQFIGAFSFLQFDNWWEQDGTATPYEVAQVMKEVYLSMRRAPFAIGTIVPTSLSVLPDYMLPCDGGLYEAADYPEYFNVVDNAFKENATQFRTPDSRNRTFRGFDVGFNMGFVGGSDTLDLTDAESLAPHNHTYNVPSQTVVTVGTGAPVPVYAPPMLPAFTGTTGESDTLVVRNRYQIVRFGVVVK